MSSPLVSIIMPVYNAERFIAKSLESVLSQTYKHWELIVVDDGSTDSTWEIIDSFRLRDNRIHYYKQQNKKQAAARNLGLSYAKGDWVAFLDADDLWEPTKLFTQLESASGNKADVLFTGGYVIDEYDKILSKYDTIYGHYSGREMYKKLCFSNPVPILSVLLKRDLVSKVGLQDEQLKIAGCEDWDYWLRLAYNNATFYGIEELLFKYRINPEGTSRKVLQMKVAECLALYKNLDLGLFDAGERLKLLERFDNLVKFIINELYTSKSIQLIHSYLELLEEVKGGEKYRYTKVLLKLFKSRSRRLVNFILYH